jgi:hypothetical protein
MLFFLFILAYLSKLGLKTHSTISGWESKKNKATAITGTTEVVVRLLMAPFNKL